MRFPPPLLLVLCKCFPPPVLFCSVPLLQSQQVRTVSPEQTLLCFSTETKTGYGYFIRAKVWLCFLEYSWNKITIAAGRCCHRFLIRLKVQNVSILWNCTLEFHGYVLKIVSHAGIYAMLLPGLFLCYLAIASKVAMLIAPLFWCVHTPLLPL